MSDFQTTILCATVDSIKIELSHTVQAKLPLWYSNVNQLLGKYSLRSSLWRCLPRLYPSTDDKGAFFRFVFTFCLPKCWGCAPHVYPIFFPSGRSYRTFVQCSIM